ncbi:hypothetical protein [Paenibacillus graminis]|uniref:hypothetical protein n=1 Tax=Paenibacillus graminis TaxID=189425 RepID=UPI002DBACDFE|nr:hypothetical protein [Paenibacillus graminis]MEC0167845.1 hypothetical protein [Paenibacillus graminis]
MKKFISGVIVGALLFGGASVFAEATNLIGQKVQGIFTIEKSGAKVADAVVINGSAYAPVRAVAEATGSKLTVEGKKIIMGDASAAPSNGTASDLQEQRAKIAKEIETYEKKIKGYNEDILPTYKQQSEELANNGALGQRAADTYAEFKKQVEGWEAEVVTLKSKLAELDAKIAQLGE